jgi:DNA polymerase III subunit chi
MTRIDFYSDAPDKLGVATRLIAKAVQQKLRVFVFTPDATLLARFDQMLWMTPSIGFIPHCFAHDKLAPETPVLLATNAEDPPHDQVMLNLADEWPKSFARFTRLLEIVSTDPDDRARARERFRFYRDRGYAIATHSMANSE